MKESLKRTHPGVMTELLEHSFIHSVLAWSPFKAPSIILSADNTVVTQTHHGVLLWKGLSPWGDQTDLGHFKEFPHPRVSGLMIKAGPGMYGISRNFSGVCDVLPGREGLGSREE